MEHNFYVRCCHGGLQLKKRDRQIVYEVYKRLSAATATLATSVVFSFDTERLTDAEMADMRRDSGGALHFLPRRHLECYLVDPDAISAFILSKDTASAQSATPGTVIAALQKAASERPFHIPEWNNDIENVDWLTRVDAAKLISHICGLLSEQRVSFNKKDDSLFLLKNIVERRLSSLEPLQRHVEGLVAAVAPNR